MRTARVAWGGTVHSAVAHADGLLLADGRVLAEHEPVWLPPIVPGTIIALGLNYADHVKELSKELARETVHASRYGRRAGEIPPQSGGDAREPGSVPSTPSTVQEEPLAFLKTGSSVVGHRGTSPRPRDAAFMHYECELAVIIGRPAKRVAAADALAHVAGYTVANDYAVRDYLENWYRPNLRVKNRDGGTVLGPWLVDAADVPDPQNLALRTLVNGKLVQQGHTGNMIHTVAALIEYLSGFMTLLPGDLILTGTPEGVVNVNPGDEVVTEIDGIGRLVNTLI